VTRATSTSSCRSGPPPDHRLLSRPGHQGRPTLLRKLSLRGFRVYRELEVSFGSGPQIVWGPNAAGKTSLLEAIAVVSRGRSHRTSTDAELIRWGADFARIDAVVDGLTPSGSPTTIEVVVTAPGRGAPGARKSVKVNGVPRRPASLVGALRTVVFAPEEMLLVSGPPTLRRDALDTLASQRLSAYARALATYGRALQQRNSVLKAIREERAMRDELHPWNVPFLDAAAQLVEERLRLLEALEEPLARAHAEIAPAGGRLDLGYVTSSPALPGESVHAALSRRLIETAEKEVWNGMTLIGPHRDDIVFRLDGREMAGIASRGQQRSAILAFKLAEVELLTAVDGRPPILLLDDVFSELDIERRGRLVERLTSLPQSFVATTTLHEIDPALRRAATTWQVLAPEAGQALELAAGEGPGAESARLVRDGVEP
jgi:DNA replication and repair protein RecF